MRSDGPVEGAARTTVADDMAKARPRRDLVHRPSLDIAYGRHEFRTGRPYLGRAIRIPSGKTFRGAVRDRKVLAS